MDDTAIAIGQRVRYWRMRRQLDRKQFADLVGRSTSWLDKIEKGERALLRLPMLERVAEALSIEPDILLDSEASGRAQRCADAVEVQAIKTALGRYPTLSAADRPDAPIEATRVQQQLQYAGHAWLSSHFAVVARALPRLLNDAQVHAAQAADEAHLAASRMLVMAYRLACSMLLKYDATDIAWLAADRSMHAAQSAADPIALARASRSAARAMSHTGQANSAITLGTDMADQLRPLLGDGDRETVPLYGMLLLSAEISAAIQGDAALARDLHHEALSAADLIGPQHRGHHTMFGRANVEVHRVSALVRLHQAPQALSYASGISPTLLDTLPAERRSNFLFDVANANTEVGKHRAAIAALADAEQLAPEEVQCRPTVRHTIEALLATCTGGADQTLRQIAHRAGVAA